MIGAHGAIVSLVNVKWTGLSLEVHVDWVFGTGNVHADRFGVTIAFDWHNFDIMVRVDGSWNRVPIAVTISTMAITVAVLIMAIIMAITVMVGSAQYCKCGQNNESKHCVELELLFLLKQAN